MSTIISKGQRILGKLSRNADKNGPRDCEAVLEWELRDNGGKLEFSATGTLWNPLKTDHVMGGQCVDTLAEQFPDDVIAQRIYKTWREWHLNDMRPGTPEQMEALKKARSETVSRLRKMDEPHLFYHDGAPNWYAIAKHYGAADPYALDCYLLKNAGLLDVPVTEEVRAAAMGGLPDDATVYRYGTRWLYQPIPDETLELIFNGFLLEGEALPESEGEGEGEPDLIEKAGITIDAQFIPLSQSRNKAEKHLSLNWSVTVKVRGRAVFVTDYSAGSAHAPAYSARANWSRRERDAAVMAECENGKRVLRVYGFGGFKFGEAIKPNSRDVIGSLLRDCDAINYTFEEWAELFGFSADSIKARKLYDACVGRAIALRSALGPDVFEQLLDAAR